MTKPRTQIAVEKLSITTPKKESNLKTSASMAGLAAIDDFIEQNKREKNLDKSTSVESCDSENSNNFTHVVRHFSGDSGVIPQTSSIHSASTKSENKKLKPVSKTSLHPGSKGLAALDKLLSSYNILNSSRRASKSSNAEQDENLKISKKLSKQESMKSKHKVKGNLSAPIRSNLTLTGFKSLDDIDKTLAVKSTTSSTDFSEVECYYYHSASLPKRGKKGLNSSTYYVSDTENGITKQKLHRTLAYNHNVKSTRKLGLTSSNFPNTLTKKKASTTQNLSTQQKTVTNSALLPRESRDSAIQLTSSHDFNLTPSSLSSGASYDQEPPLAIEESFDIRRNNALKLKKSSDSVITRARIKKNFIKPLLNYRTPVGIEQFDLQHHSIPVGVTKKEKVKLSRSDEPKKLHASMNFYHFQNKQKGYRSESEWEGIQNAFPVSPITPIKNRKDDKYFSDTNSHIRGEAERKKKIKKVYAPTPGNEKLMNHKGIFNRVFTGFR